MIHSKNSKFPTQFAIEVAIVGDLYVPPDEERGNEELYVEMDRRLANFQKMAISTDFHTSMVAYFGMDIDKDQVKYLQFIHANTKKWIRGHLAETLLGQLEAGSIMGKDASSIVERLLTDFIGDAGDKRSENKKGVLIRLASGDNSAEEKEPEKDVNNS